MTAPLDREGRSPRDRQIATARDRAIHRRMRGERAHTAGRFSAGTLYVADDPELPWILAGLADSAQTVYERYMRGLSAREREPTGRTTGHRAPVRLEGRTDAGRTR